MFFLAAARVTKQEWHVAVGAPSSESVTAADVGVLVVAPLSVDLFLILKVDPCRGCSEM